MEEKKPQKEIREDEDLKLTWKEWIGMFLFILFMGLMGYNHITRDNIKVTTEPKQNLKMFDILIL